MCGILGVVAGSEVAASLYDGLTVLQHRGQDAAGIATVDGRRLHLHKARGLVRDVFTPENVQPLRGRLGIAHCRYPTQGNDNAGEAQPFYVNSPFGIALAHNGNLVNAATLKQELFEADRRHLNTDSDSEVLLNVLAHELAEQSPQRPTADTVFAAMAGVHRRCIGGYACVALILGLGVVAFRDPNGIRPLVLGERVHGGGSDWMVASESVALDVLGFRVVGDVAPGETVILTEDGQLLRRRTAEAGVRAPCIFEYVYLARPDSMIEDVSVYKARARMGEKLAQKIARVFPQHDIDKVIPIPDTSCTIALALARALGIEYREGFVKNRYIGRTFIMPGQEERVKSVRRKLNAISLEFRNRNVLLVDDSIVRGTTSKQIIQMAREAGARKVYFASAAPPVRHANVYGIDMPAPEELVAHGRSEAEIQQLLGCDGLIYQDLADLIEAVAGSDQRLHQFDTSCFSGEYVTGLPADYLDRAARERNDAARAARRAA